MKTKNILICFLFIFLFFSLNYVSAVDIPKTGTIPNVVIGANESCPVDQFVYGFDRFNNPLCAIPAGNGSGGGNVSKLTDLSDVDPALQYDLHFLFFGDGAGTFTSGTFSHSWLDDIGTYSHAQIDSHIEDVANPHATTYDQVGAVGIDNDETITGLKTFDQFPLTPSLFPLTDYQVANKVYVDSVALGMQWKPAVLSRTVNDSITCNSSTLGDRYVVPLGAGGDWIGYDNNLTECNGTNWLFEAPSTGWAVIVLDVSQGWVYNGLVWALFSNPTAYNFNQGVKLVGFDVQADLLDGGGLNLSGDSIQISSVDWNKVNKSGSLINDLGDVEASPINGDCLVYNSTSGLWASGSCGTGGGGSGGSEAIDTLSFLASPQTAHTWTNMPLAETELFATVYARLRMDTSLASYYRLFVSQSVAGYSTAVLRLQYSTNQTTWTNCDGTNLAVGAGTGLKSTAWLSVPAPCKGDYYYRVVGQAGDGVVDPAWRQIDVQFKQLVSGAANNTNYTITGASDTNLTGVSDGQAITWSQTQLKWVPTTWGVLGEDNNWTSVVTDTIFFASTPATAQTWTNQPAAVTELFGIVYARHRKDLTYSSYYKIYADQAAAGYSTAVLRLQYSPDNVLWLDCSGDNLAINATGFRQTDWISIPTECRGDYYLRLVGQAGDGVVDPSFRAIAVQFKNLVGDTNATNWNLVGLGDVNITNPLDGQTIFWDGTQSKWVSRNIGLANGSNVITLELPFVSSGGYGQIWTNMPLATTELYSSAVYARTKYDLSSATEYRFVLSQSVAGATNAVLRLQCSSDQVLWVDCNETNISANLVGFRVGNWLPYPEIYKGDVYLRIVGQGGDGALDPAFREIKVQFHVIAGNNTGGSGSGGNPFDQSLNTTDSVIFNHLYLNSAIAQVMNITGSGGGLMNIVVTDEPLTTGYPASENSLGRGSDGLYQKMGTADENWSKLTTEGGCNEPNQFVTNTTREGVICAYATIVEGDPVYTAENSTIARTGAGVCSAGEYANSATTSTTGITLVCSEPTITETDPYWSGNQSNYFNKTDINSTYVPYTGAINMLNLGTWGISGSTNITTGKMIIAQVGGVIIPKTNSFITSPAQLADISYALPTTLPMTVSQYLRSDISGKLSWQSISFPAESDPIFVGERNNGVTANWKPQADATYDLGVGMDGLRWKDLWLSGNLDDGAGNQCNVQVACTDNVGDTIPAGMLAPFYLSACPSGWIMANGTAGTPDLRDKFVAGAGTTFVTNTSGGAINHTHSFTPAGAISGGPGTTFNAVTPNARATFIGSVGTTGINNPPYYSTIWCMKT